MKNITSKQTVMKFLLTIQISLLTIIAISGCGPLESGVIDSGFLNTGGTDDPRRLIGIAYNRMYKSNRIVGARNVLKRAIERSIKENDPYTLAVSYNMMGFTYIQKEKESKDAGIYYQKAIEIIEENYFDCELIHYYVGIALINEMQGIIENSCVYERKAKKTLDQVKYNFQNQIRIYKGGQKAIITAENRIKDLSLHLRCEK
ncbi:MAG: hypothetical protein GY795_19325 [Desulfobacterales bacterium]|nr:hypothetical protein [Desulfobacterales bacterium]